MTLRSNDDRRRACKYVQGAPYATRVEFKATKRTLPQNDRFWAMLTDVAEQVPWHGVRLRPDDWKLIFLDALKQEMRIVPNLNGDGFVNLGRSSSDLTIGEMSDLMELMSAWGAQHNVKFHEPPVGVSPGETQKNAEEVA
jgi:hypothetical protein